MVNLKLTSLSPLLLCIFTVYVPQSIFSHDLKFKKNNPLALDSIETLSSSFNISLSFNHVNSGKGIPVTSHSIFKGLPRTTVESTGFLTNAGKSEIKFQL